MGGSPVFLDPLIIPLIEGPAILDLGCGFGKWGALCTTNYWETVAPVPQGRPRITGCDAFQPNVDHAMGSGFYEAVRQALFPPLPFEEASFDTVLLVEVIEHLEEAPGRELLEEAKRVARKRVVLSTPNYSALRPGHSTMTGYNDHEAHLSYWTREMLRAMGFRLYGAGGHPGGRIWRGGLHRLGLLPWYDRVGRQLLSGPSHFFPALSDNVVGVWQRSALR
ncbi:MAG: class I SAM-dependent methyltransferase [Magnetococcales bacterium]|nr:class I SAM-dependent methyltransferase [Magnetococcales bacterium]